MNDAANDDMLHTPEENARDAARYRKLRECNVNTHPRLCVVANPKKSVIIGTFCPYGDFLDDAVDKLP